MREQDLKELLELEKSFHSKLVETIDVTRELIEASERQDQMSLQMVVSMRQKPLFDLQETSSFIALKRVELSPKDAEDFDWLLAGGAPETPQETPVAEQIAANKRLLERLISLDRQVSEKLCGDESFYRK